MNECFKIEVKEGTNEQNHAMDPAFISKKRIKKGSEGY
jgi:hypothetical protein